MSILINKDTRGICQGITGNVGQFHTKGCKEYGTKMVGGVTPGKAGQTIEGLPVFDTVEDAVKQTGANATMIFVPPAFTADAILEAVDAGIGVIDDDHQIGREQISVRHGLAFRAMRGILSSVRPLLRKG